MMMESRQVPMIEQSARAWAATQSFAQPDILNLNLYGHMGRWISSWYSFVRS